jgi:hypothetical protein
MSWRMSTFAVSPDSGYQVKFSAWFMLDNGQAWGVNVRMDDVWDNNEQSSPEILRLDGGIVRVNADETIYPDSPSVATLPDGLLVDVPLEGWGSTRSWCSDGQYLYYISGYFGIRRVDVTNLRVDTVVGRADTHPDNTTFINSHNGTQAYTTNPMGDTYVDRDGRYLYWWDRKRGDWSGSGYPPSWNSGVGAYLRRMSLDGSHAVETVSGRIDSVQHPSALVLHDGRFWFNYRDPALGESYVNGYHGIASVNQTGGDFKLHYVDPRDGAADDPCGFCNAFAPIAIVGDKLITGNNAGQQWVLNRDEGHRFISFDLTTFTNNPDVTYVHDPQAPIYEVLAGLDGFFGKSGQPGGADYRDGDQSMLGMITNAQFSRSRYPGWEDTLLLVSHIPMGDVAANPYKPVAVFRTLQPNTDIWDVRVLFTGEAFKGYDHVYPQVRTGPLEFELYNCDVVSVRCEQMCVEEPYLAGGDGGLELHKSVTGTNEIPYTLSGGGVYRPSGEKYPDWTYGGGWIQTPGFGSAGQFWEVDTVNPLGGSSHLRWAATGSPRILMWFGFQLCWLASTGYVPVSAVVGPGNSVSFSVYAMASAGTPTLRMRLHFLKHEAGLPEAASITVEDKTLSSTYTKYTISAVAPAGSAYLRADILPLSGSIVYDVDDSVLDIS